MADEGTRPPIDGRREAVLDRLLGRFDGADPEVRVVCGMGRALQFRGQHDADRHDAGQRASEPTAGELLEAIGLLPAVLAVIDGHTKQLIEQARRAGVTWQAIGVSLGYKPSGARQAARQRYQRLGGQPTELDDQIEEQAGIEPAALPQHHHRQAASRATRTVGEEEP